jgi:protoporphyrin/coproporphyrin ferrochelatase
VFDAVMVLSFGGPEGPADVVPFLANVLRGRPAPPGRLEQIATHYMQFGGRSPINAINRALVDALGAAQTRPVYWGNRNWRPYVADTVAAMRDDGVSRAAVFATSAYSSYSGCRQYLEDLGRARAAVGPGAPDLVKLRPFSDHPGFIEPLAEGLRAALATTGPDTPVLMSAHSLPVSQAATCTYQSELQVAAARVAGKAAVRAGRWQLVFQSRSGPPSEPWLGPDIGEAITALPSGADAVIVVPIGFVSDHMEVVYDLDEQARAVARDRGLGFVRTPTPGTDPLFVSMICDLIGEAEQDPRYCPPGCCPPLAR